MRKKINEALRDTLQDLIDTGVKTSFTEKELKSLGVSFNDINITPTRIKKIRKESKYSQSVFAKLLNVSLSSVRQWEQGSRQPTGSAKVLLELLEKEPHILDYRIKQDKMKGKQNLI
jgi:putative transcriptional regulator